MLSSSSLRASECHQRRFVVNRKRQCFFLIVSSEGMVYLFSLISSNLRCSSDELSVVHSNIFNFLLTRGALESMLLSGETKHVIVLRSVVNITFSNSDGMVLYMLSNFLLFVTS
jgi:hypothetical protein